MNWGITQDLLAVKSQLAQIIGLIELKSQLYSETGPIRPPFIEHWQKSNVANIFLQNEQLDQIDDLRPFSEELNDEERNDGATRPYIESGK